MHETTHTCMHILVICLGGQQMNCPGIDSIYANPLVKNCSAGIVQTGNQINGDLTVVAQPQITYNPPQPDNVLPNPVISVVAFCTTDNATIRYTLDGSRPEETSPVFPAGSAGVPLTW